jgi:16S rRNA (guanine527-N7)-methyltransferase
VTKQEIREALLARIDRAGIVLSAAAIEALEDYFALLARWNPKVNLTALPLDPPRDETFDRLFVEPLVAAQHVHPTSSAPSGIPAWFDLGSGGGSPAIPLKIVRPEWPLTMVEARERKAAFLREAVRALRLQGAEVSNVRAEELQSSNGSADLVTVRAVKLDAELGRVVHRLLSATGILAVFAAAGTRLDGFATTETVVLNASSILTLLRRVPRGT